MTGWIMAEHGILDSRWIVVRQVEDYIQPCGKHIDLWECKCNCGNPKTFFVRGAELKRGGSKSCGCLRLEKLKNNKYEHKKKLNKWIDEIFEDEHGKYKIGLASNTGSEFYIDLEDYEKVKDYTWCEYIDDHGHKTIRTVGENSKNFAMHQILGFYNGDHADRNPLNNRKYNLRKCTASQNDMNRSLFKNNKSGVTGVWWNAKANRWRVRIQVDGKEIHIGHFVNKEDAIIARLKAEVKYFEEFAPQKHLFKKYGIGE